MALPNEIGKSLTFLRKKYKVSERDLVSLAKKLDVKVEPEESWEQIVIRSLRNRQGRFAKRKRYHK